MEYKAGTRLRSVTDSTEVVIVKSVSGDLDLRCGGHPMVTHDAEAPGGLSVEAGFDGGSLLGKRYGDEATGLEVLCTKAGPGSISVGVAPLLVKGAKPLPSSD
jgi:hypothetical protein